jgi:hypothetical protein
VQPFRAQFGNDLCRIVLIIELARMTRGTHIAMPNGTTLPADREAGLVQVAYALFQVRFPVAGLFCACRRHGGRSYAQKE